MKPDPQEATMDGGMSLIGLTIFIIFVVLVLIPSIVSMFLRNVEAGTIRMVSWLKGATVIYRGPGKSIEIPLLTVGTTLSSKAINVDLDITDQTADVDDQGIPRPIKVRVLASAIVSVGDTDTLIKTAANRFFSKPMDEQLNILIDLLSSSGRRAINLLTHDQLFSAKTTPPRPAVTLPSPGAQTDAQTLQTMQRGLAAREVIQVAEDDDDPLAIIIRKACSRELTDLGLIFNSLNIKVVQSEVAEARRRQSAAEAQANAEIVAAQQARRAKEAQLEAERVISDKQRELEQTRAANAALIAHAEAKKQEALAGQREAELTATQITQASADAERVRIVAQAQAQAEAIRITTVAQANAESIRKVNEAIMAGGESYFRYRQIEMLPQITPSIAQALAQARLVTIAGGDGSGAAGTATNNITSVIQTVLAAQLVASSGLLDGAGRNNGVPPAAPPAPAVLPSPPAPQPHGHEPVVAPRTLNQNPKP
jgi:flotillin